MNKIMVLSLVMRAIYNAKDQAWLLMKINNVKPDDIFKPKNPGDVVKYLDNETMNQIVQYIINT